MNFSQVKQYLFFICCMSVILLSACAGSNDNNNETADNESTGNNEITVDSEMGEVTLPSAPQRILAPYHEDTLLALGITPVAKWSIDKQPQAYLEQDLKDVDDIEWTMPKEQVLEKDPDLIILENSLDGYEGSYDDYEAIAPTFVMSEQATIDWKKQLEVFGEILNKETEAVQALEDYETEIEQTKEELEDKIGNESLAMMWVTGGKYFLFEQDRFSADMIYSELHVKVPALVEELGGAEASWDPISLEKLSELDADHMIILGHEDDEGIEKLNASSVWKRTPAVEKDQVYYFDDVSNWSNSGIIASERTMDQLKEIFE